MKRIRSLAGVIFIFAVVVFSLAASLRNGDEDSTQTTPYLFNTPQHLLPVFNPKDNPATEEGVALGRKLFYDPVLSGNQNQSCASCHKQALAFTDGKQLGIGSLGKNVLRNSMTLVNLGWLDRYFWDGRAHTLEGLVYFPITNPLEMNADTARIVALLNADNNYRALFKKAFGKSDIDMPQVSKALAQFLRSIVSYNAPIDIIGRDYFYNNGLLQTSNYNVSDSVLLTNMFGAGNEGNYKHNDAIRQKIKDISADTKVIATFTVCIKCHYNSLQVFCEKCNQTIPLTAKVQFKNNGLEIEGADKGLYAQTNNEADKYRFKVPTLRNLLFTGPYMHDGRFKTLQEVIEHYNTGIQPNKNLDTLLMDKNKQPIKFNLSQDEVQQLIGLLKLFTDSSVITDKRFSAPVTQ